MTPLVQSRQLCRLRGLASDRAARALGLASAATDAAAASLAHAERTVLRTRAAVLETRYHLASDPAGPRLACLAAATRAASDASDSRAAAADTLAAARADEAIARAALIRARLRADAMNDHSATITVRLARAAEERGAREAEDQRGAA